VPGIDNDAAPRYNPQPPKPEPRPSRRVIGKASHRNRSAQSCTEEDTSDDSSQKVGETPGGGFTVYGPGPPDGQLMSQVTDGAGDRQDDSYGCRNVGNIQWYLSLSPLFPDLWTPPPGVVPGADFPPVGRFRAWASPLAGAGPVAGAPGPPGGVVRPGQGHEVGP
jgi:hypothetical protein